MEAKEIQKLKKEHGELVQFDFPCGESLILKTKVDEVTYKAISKFGSDEVSMVKVAINALCVHGDVKTVIDDFDSVRSAMAPLGDIIKIKQAEVKKL